MFYDDFYCENPLGENMVSIAAQKSPECLKLLLQIQNPHFNTFLKQKLIILKESQFKNTQMFKMAQVYLKTGEIATEPMKIEKLDS